MQQSPPRRFFFAVFIAAAIFPGAVSAGGPVFQADVVATSLHAGSSIHLEGPMVAFLQEDVSAETGGAAADFRLEAATLRVETESSDPSLHTAAFEFHHQPTASPPEFYSNANVIGTANRDEYRWDVFAMDSAHPPRVAVSSGCANAQPSVLDSLHRNPKFGNRSEMIVPTADALQWDCIDGGTVTVTGDFRLSLWAWNATLTAPGASKEIHSGKDPSNALSAGASNLSGTVTYDREVYLFAKNATLTVPALAGKGYTLLTGLGALLSATDVALEGVAGHLTVQGHDAGLQGSAVSFKGQAEAKLSGTGVGKPFSVVLAGTPNQLTVDGKTFSSAVAPKTLATWKVLPWAVGGAAILALLGIGRAAALVAYQLHASLAGPARGVRHRAALGYSLLSTFQIDAGNLRLARFLAWRAIRVLPASAEGYLAHAEAARRLHAHRAALRDHEALDDLLADGRQRAINACNAAATLCQLKRPAEAVEWLQTAESQDAALTVAQAARDEFDVLGEEPYVRSLRLRAHADSSYIQ